MTLKLLGLNEILGAFGRTPADFNYDRPGQKKALRSGAFLLLVY